MRIVLHIGLEQCGAERLQEVLDAKRDQLTDKGVLYARSPGRKNHTRLYMAVTDPDRVDILRHNRGYAPADKQDMLRRQVGEDLLKEVEKHRPETLILSASQLCTLPYDSEIARLKSLLQPLSDDIQVIAHVDEQGRDPRQYRQGPGRIGLSPSLRRQPDPRAYDERGACGPSCQGAPVPSGALAQASGAGSGARRAYRSGGTGGVFP
ncbi:hypothetical protein AKJ29_11705 [Aliiroseovarius crassostreae]|uniref:Uncharacterized protein n=1 Tax=Aliiroseovarius crassostreae TaxID=154981 RepID=A0A0P7IXA6_9RHOB|nr:hypothetical protein [Aliiroseovarius crassostreae]KPN63335.1 hypothetical protein AKJ29_11705 [Aliiroseovarius crassostreae]